MSDGISCFIMKNGEKIAKGSSLKSASWTSLLRYYVCQSYMVLVSHTIMYINGIAPVLCLVQVISSWFFLIVHRQEKVFLRILRAHVIMSCEYVQLPVYTSLVDLPPAS